MGWSRLWNYATNYWAEIFNRICRGLTPPNTCFG